MAIAVGPTRSTKRTSARTRAESLCRRQSNRRAKAAISAEVNAFTTSKVASMRQIPSSSYMLICLSFQFSLLFFHQSVELIEQFAITLADGVDDAGEHGLYCF